MKNIFTLLALCMTGLLMAQTATVYPDFTDCIRKMAIDEDNDVIWMGTGITDGGKLFMKDADGMRRDISDFSSDINFQSVSAMHMADSELYVAGYGAIAIVDYDSEDAPLFFTNDNSDLNYSNEFITIMYDSNKEQVIAGNQTIGSDIYDIEAGTWSVSNELTRLRVSHYYDDEDLYIYVLSDGKVFISADDEGLEPLEMPDDYPVLPYYDLEIIVNPDNDDDVKLVMMTIQDGLVVVSENSTEHYTSLNSNIFPSDLNGMTQTDDGTIWLAHNGGITSFKDGIFNRIPLEPLVGFFTDVQDIVADQNNDLWLGTCSGLIKLSDLPSNTKELSDLNISVFPTVNDGFVHVDSEYAGTIQFFNIDGSLILEQQINAGTNSLTLNAIKGMCLYSIQTMEGVKQGKLFVQE